MSGPGTEVGYDDVRLALAGLGLIPRGGFHPGGEEDLAAASVILVGNVGPAMWRHFPGPDGSRDALDAWCRARLTPLAGGLGAHILFPFDGPPYHPFITWAQRAEGLSPSPIGPLIHPEFGPWHAYRAALLFDHKMALPPPLNDHPCDTCRDKPCLTTCPVSAFGGNGYDIPACTGHLKQPQGADCLDQGCRARRACPIGREYLYEPAQANFHMAAFLRNY
jgi:hypothetical protein